MESYSGPRSSLKQFLLSLRTKDFSQLITEAFPCIHFSPDFILRAFKEELSSVRGEKSHKYVGGTQRCPQSAPEQQICRNFTTEPPGIGQSHVGSLEKSLMSCAPQQRMLNRDGDVLPFRRSILKAMQTCQTNGSSMLPSPSASSLKKHREIIACECHKKVKAILGKNLPPKSTPLDIPKSPP